MANSKNKTRPQRADRPTVVFGGPLFWRTSFALVVAVTLVYGSTAGHEFVAYDDDRYVYNNPVVTSGLSLDGILSAFTQQKFAASYPATSISHMITWEVFGDNPAGHHLVNVVLHSANSILLLALFSALTGQFWIGTAIAMCFAVHPLHVESVAWVTERKDVLSTFFGLLALLTYLRYAMRPDFPRYAAVLVLFGLALLSKSMLVTLPCVFLLLDYWPLERTRKAPRSEHGQQTFPTRSIQQLVVEKVPLLILSLTFCINTYSAHLQTTSSTNPTTIPLLWRILGAPVSYVTYLAKGIWPTDLACFYPHPALVAPERLSEYGLKAGIASVILLLITTVAVIQRRKRPWLLVGWFWYLGMLAPVLGVVQVGYAAMADRFIYLPFIGIYLILASGGLELARRFPAWRNIIITAACVVFVMWATLAAKQVRVWRDSEQLFTHALEVTDRNALVHNNFGIVLFQAGEYDRAAQQFYAAISIDRSIPDYHDNLGILWANRGDLRRAVSEFRRALAISPKNFDVNYHMGEALFRLENFEGAIQYLQQADAVQPGHPEVRRYLNQARAFQRGRR